MGNSTSKGKSAPPKSKKEIKLEKKYGLESGSAKSSERRVEAGWASLRGKRPYQEDVVYCSFDRACDGGEVGCFGVFDGHGGQRASKFVAEHLYQNLLRHETFETNLFKAVEDAYLETDQDYVDLDQKTRQDDGTTAVTAVLVGQRLVMAHVGDSRAILCEGGTAIPLTEDHKPDRSDERDRVESKGGTVVWAGTWRVGGVLAVSRSFGNRMMKHLIIPHPEIREDILHGGNSALVLGSDGLWDVITNQSALDIARRHPTAESAARALVTEAYVRGSQDNISCIVVFFNFPRTSAERVK